MSNSTTCNYPDMTVFVDGKIAKLRASCDACNESKVRCSQAKPRCARCEKHGITCVYGLSRRSHKNAPRIGACQPSAIRPSTANTNSSNNSNDSRISISVSNSSDNSAVSPLLISPTLGLHDATNADATIRPSGLTPSMHLLEDDVDFGGIQDINSLAETSFLSSLMQSPESGPHAHQGFDPLDDLSATTGFDPLSQCLSIPSPVDMSFLGAGEGLMTTEFNNGQKRPNDQSCNCASRVMKQLTVMPLMFEDDSSPFDARLSQLRRAIKVSEECIRCNCITKDQMSLSRSESKIETRRSGTLTFFLSFFFHAVTISILVGRVVQGFEATLAKVSPSCSSPENFCSGSASSSDSSSSSSSPDTASPRLSWGVLQLEPDEENELKQHLWLLQFRKLQKVLRQFSASVSRLRDAQGSENSAHVMACQCIHMWLAQRADMVRDKYQAQDGSRTVVRLGVSK
ncbi:hypothetical protein PT974_01807 [Cladobotryum mycophilum]|uniref:Zn(2)-C6 fungal-type domain-containing protein n=1 Tax=Cladobotryum mycophilum TaxID=491253 RepID=A0ABR0SWE6_9HYPO